MSGWDIIGDIHGDAVTLQKLLQHLGYSNGVHPEGRQLLSLGDVINRGHGQREVITLVKEWMPERIKGNHELSLERYLYRTANGYLRPHTPANAKYHAKFFEEIPLGSDALKDVLDLIKTMRLYFRGPGFNAVHACWSEEIFKACAPYLDEKGQITEEAYPFLDEEVYPDSFALFDTITAGPIYKLPPSAHYQSPTGNVKSSTHIFWWETDEPREKQVNEGSQFAAALTDAHWREIGGIKARFARAARETPLFIGHYFLPGEPRLLTPTLACLDFRGGITAYRWNDGDTSLKSDRLVHIKAP